MEGDGEAEGEARDMAILKWDVKGGYSRGIMVYVSKSVCVVLNMKLDGPRNECGLGSGTRW